jgi:hypothetical protein
MARAIHRLLDVLTDNGRHPDNVFIAIAGLLVLCALAAGWLD